MKQIGNCTSKLIGLLALSLISLSAGCASTPEPAPLPPNVESLLRKLDRQTRELHEAREQIGILRHDLKACYKEEGK